MKRYSSISKVLPLILLLFSFYSHAQRESANWYFGDNAGIRFFSGDPVAVLDGSLNTKEGCATISDPSGNLLFYTDGTSVWDRTHDLMPNGYGLMGDSSSTESAIIIPKPGSPSIYYIFTTDRPNYYLTPDDPIEGLNYTEVDMTLNGGLGDIVTTNKNNHLITYNINDAVQNEYKNSEKLTAVTHNNGQDIWVITQFMNKFYAFIVTSSGVNETPNVSTVTQTVFPRINDIGSNVTAIGYLKVSPDGSKIAIAHSSTSLGSPTLGKRRSGKVLLYDFNNTTGNVTNEQLILENSYPYGVEFSPNSKLLYVTATQFSIEDSFVDSSLLQYNTESSNIAGSQYTVNTSSNVAGALQLGINGKIYRAGYSIFSTGTHLSVINDPNSIGNNCNYTHNSFFLQGRTSQIGLPPFIQSIFKFSFDFEDTCYNDNTHFYITSEDPYDSVLWDFGDGTTSTEIEPYHTYAQSGNYLVRLIMTLNGVDYQPLQKIVKIESVPDVIQTPYDLVTCDSFDNDPTDGIAIFSLKDANSALLIDPTEYIDVYYYHTLDEATSDIDNLYAINHDNYVNQFDEEIVVAKVKYPNALCYSIAYVRLSTTQAVDVGMYQLEACDLYNASSALFDLTTIRDQVIANLPLSGDITVNFYLSQANAAGNINSLPDTYNSGNNLLYISISNENVCYGYGQLELILRDFPDLEDQNIEICSRDFPLTLTTGLTPTEVANYNITWSTTETTNSIVVDQPSIYIITISDPILNCEKSSTVIVTQSPLPEIQQVIIDDYTVTIDLAESQSVYEFAMDNANGVFQESNVFNNLSPGIHTIYIRDINQCEIISKDITVMGFPKYFTPNNDSNHDYWNVIGLEGNQYSFILMYIYDRYGKLITMFNPTTSLGWDGKYNQKLLPQNDYWYKLRLSDGTYYSGHFTLRQ